LRGTIIPVVDIAVTKADDQELLPRSVIVAVLTGDERSEDTHIGIAADEVIGNVSGVVGDFAGPPRRSRITGTKRALTGQATTTPGVPRVATCRGSAACPAASGPAKSRRRRIRSDHFIRGDPDMCILAALISRQHRDNDAARSNPGRLPSVTAISTTGMIVPRKLNRPMKNGRRAAHASSAPISTTSSTSNTGSRIFHGSARKTQMTRGQRGTPQPLRKSPADRQPPNPVKVALNDFIAINRIAHFTKEVFVGKRFHNITVRPLLLGPVTVARSRFRCHQNTGMFM